VSIPPEAVSAAVLERARGALARRGLVELTPLGYLAPDGPPLDRPVELSIPTGGLALPQGVSPRQLVVVRVSQGRDPVVLAARTATESALAHRLETASAAPAGGGPSAARSPTMTAASDRLGLFVVAADQRPPSLEVDWPSGPLSDRPLLTGRAADDGAGIDVSSGYATVDGRRAPASIDAHGNVRFEPPWDLLPGDHALVMGVADRAGNEVKTTQHHLAVGGPLEIEQAVFVPSPATRPPVAFRYLLTASASRVVVKIHDVAGGLVKTLSGDGVPGANTLMWDLDSRDGTTVANGVYLYTVEATGTDGRKVRSRGKFAVIR
jgi:hypothetical protein